MIVRRHALHLSTVHCQASVQQVDRHVAGHDQGAAENGSDEGTIRRLDVVIGQLGLSTQPLKSLLENLVFLL